MFKEYKTFYYFDASVRIKKRKLEHLLGTQKRDVPPLILYNQAVHSVYATVHPGKSRLYLLAIISLFRHVGVFSTTEINIDSSRTRVQYDIFQ
jgi:hypothetical protein